MNAIAWVIVGCEIAFWVVIALGLSFRYILRMPAVGMLLLALTPLIDLILLAVTGWDLYNGGIATTAHGVAAVYIGVSIAFGRQMVAWADERVRYYIARQGEKPVKLYGLAHSRSYLKSWTLHLLAYGIGCGILLLLTHLVQDSSRTQALGGIIRIWSVVLGIDLVIAVTYFIWPRKAPGGDQDKRLS
ncbi:MAG: hypothetical protein K0R57_4461 [Paenibacillaceae bacterium]|nr:hypothetical protein [Paenibacillaceae bacterium]